LFCIYCFVERAFFTEGLTWIEAQRCCASRSGQLATTNDAIVNCKNIPKSALNFKIWIGDIRKHSEWIEFQGKFNDINRYIMDDGSSIQHANPVLQVL